MKGTTWDQFQAGDLSYLFRKQQNRSLSQVDTLIQRQEYLRNTLGEQKAGEIEKDPDFFYNHERFRIWQAKARFRAGLTTIVAVPALLTVANRGRNGVEFLTKSSSYIGWPVLVGCYMGSFYVWHRYVGFNRQVQMEQSYAKNIKMMRNFIIRQ